MSARGLSGLLRQREVGNPTFLELFFDLAFAFGVGRIAQGLFDNLTWQGALDTTQVACALWFTWLTTVWLTEALDVDHLVVQTLIIVLMLGALIFAASVGGVFLAAAGSRTEFFSISFVAIRLVQGLFLLAATRGHVMARARLLWSLILSAPLWLSGGFLPRSDQEILWTAAIVLDFTGAVLGWPLPGHGRTQPDEPVAAEHLAQRCRGFIIIALGETVLTITARFAEQHLGLANWAAFASCFVLIVLFWRIYIHRAGELMHHAISASSRQTLFQHGASLCHLVIVLGIVFTNTALRLTIMDPQHARRVAWTMVLLAGPVIFLIGRTLLELNVFGHVSWERLAGAAVIVALYPAGLALPPAATLALVDVVLLAIAVVDTLHWRTRPVPVRGSGSGGPPSTGRGRAA